MSLTSIYGKISAAAVFLVVFVYVVYRAIYVPFCNDEAISFFTYISDGRFLPFYNAEDFSANNHLLNSFLAWITFKIFGIHVFVLRLPNVLAFVLYAFYAYKYAILFRAKQIQWVAFLALILSSYYFLDFFSLSRGYGLSYAFFLASLYHLLRAHKSQNLKTNIVLSWVFITLATLANLAFLIGYFIWWGFALLLLSQNKWTFKKIVFGILPVLPAIWFIHYSLQLKMAGELYHGQISLATSLWTLFTKLLPIESRVYFYCVLVFVLVLIGFACWVILKKGFLKVSKLHIVLGFFLGNILGAVILKAIMDVPYPSSRTALHWYLFFLIFLPVLVNALAGTARKLAFAMSVIILVAISFNSIAHVGQKTSAEYFWNTDQIPDSFYQKFIKIQTEKGHRLSVATQRTYTTNTWAFLNASHPEALSSLGKEFKTDPKMNADVCIANAKEFPQLLRVYKTLEFDLSSGLSLLQRKNMLVRNIVSTSTKSFANRSEDFFSLFSDSISSFQSNPIQLDFEIKVSTKNEAYNGFVFVSMIDSLGNQVYYEQFRTWFFIAAEDHSRQINFNLIVDEVPKNAAVVDVMIWNIDRQEIEKIESKVALIQLSEPNEISIFEQ